jgi:pyrroline-5-carboxylate reductase
MNLKKVGIIGAGRMGRAFIDGLLNSGAMRKDQIISSDIDRSGLEVLRGKGVEVTTDNRELVSKSSVILLAVKPKDVEKVLEEIKDILGGKLLISIAAGVSTSFIEGRLGEGARVVRAMPNLGCIVGEGATAYSLGKNVDEGEEKVVKELLGGVSGFVVRVREDMLDAVTALSGSGPAYFFYMIKALVEAGVEEGISRDIALRLAAQTAKGAGEIILETGKGPDELIEMVRSPKGTTEEGLRVLEARGVFEAFKEAVRAARRRSAELAK